MKTIRKKTFETNSSSTHSYTLCYENYDVCDTVRPNDDGVLTIHLGEFGWGYDKYSDAYTKLSYLATYLKYTDKEMDPLQEMLSDYFGRDITLIIKGEGYVDHQSLDMDIFFNPGDWQEFVFNRNSKLIIDNDNH